MPTEIPSTFSTTGTEPLPDSWWQSFEDEELNFLIRQALKDNGHTVLDFSMKDSRNKPSEYDRYFIDKINLENNKNPLNKFFHILYCRQAKRSLEKLIKKAISLKAKQHDITSTVEHIKKCQRNMSTIGG